MNIIRLFSTSLKNVTNSELAQLRKRTGFSFVNCRNALKLNDNDVDKSLTSFNEDGSNAREKFILAEVWLKNEAKKLGWEKAMKLENRTAFEGLIAVAQRNNKIVMAEINCETDFVARNEKFVSLCQVVAKACLSHEIPQLDKNTKKVLLTDELLNLKTSENEKLNDYIVMRIAEFGEKIKLRRALFYEGNNDTQINFSVHPPITDGSEVCTGKYGAFVAYKKLSGSATDDSDCKLGVNLCKHIIALNPTEVGSPEDSPSNTSLNTEESDSSKSENDFNPDEMESPNHISKTEPALIHQDFIMSPEKTVGEVLTEHGMSIVSFHRFQCGEDTEIVSESDEKQGHDVEEDMKMRRAE